MGDQSKFLNLLVHFVADVKYGTVVKETEKLSGFLVPDGTHPRPLNFIIKILYFKAFK